ncbi:MAG: NIPSNAP family protein [Gemmatimonadota bacterium]|nr:MAG: NIPSNAP family protein [Gemmatimonadota bacterium]
MKGTRKALAPALAALVVALVLTQVGFAAKQPSDKVFWMTISEVPIESLQQFHTLSAETIMPLFEDHGCRWVASWQTVIGDVEEVVNVAEFESIDAYHRAKVSLLASPDWKQLSSALRPLVRSSEQRLLSATEYSPLQ